MGLFDNRLKYVNCGFWDATKPDFTFPEVNHIDARRREVGVAFSGGGTRSASASLGQLRALSELGLLGRIGYISAVSGGSWACTPFTYLPPMFSDVDFLGRPVEPEDLTPAKLTELDPTSFAHAVANSSIIDDFLEWAFRLAGDETYSRAIGDSFLEPFGVDSLRRFFFHDSTTVQTILQRNPRMEATDFYTTRPHRPYLIVGGVILRPENAPNLRRIHFEMTPLYVGARTLHENAGSNGRHLGGGYVEPFGFDSDFTRGGSP